MSHCGGSLPRNVVDAAAELAARMHAAQRYGGQPYMVHLQAVVDVLREQGALTPELEIVAWLHDTLEDTTLTPAAIESQFGPRVREFVQHVSFERGTKSAITSTEWRPRH